MPHLPAVTRRTALLSSGLVVPAAAWSAQASPCRSLTVNLRDNLGAVLWSKALAASR